MCALKLYRFWNSTWALMCLELSTSLLAEACPCVSVCFQKRKVLWACKEWLYIMSDTFENHHNMVLCICKCTSECWVPESRPLLCILWCSWFPSLAWKQVGSVLALWNNFLMRHRQDFFHYLRLPHLCYYIPCQKKNPIVIQRVC